MSADSSQRSANFYRALEDRFRGDAEEIRSRLSVYLPFVRALSRLHPDAAVADLGCGRGEWLELLHDNEITAQGVDADAGMLRACEARGLRAVQGDALAFLRSLPDETLSAVTAFHVAEHLSIGALHELMEQSLRVLRPAGLLILETPNPESLIVSSTDFHLDPTHTKPLPPKLLEFMAQYHGFDRTHLLRLQQQEFTGDGPSLWSVLAGVSPDYALVAQKAAGTLVSRALEDAFTRERGTTLITQAARFDRAMADTLRAMDEKLHAMRDRIREISAVAEHARYQAGLAELRSAEAERFAHERQEELAQVYGSRSWRLTRPLRWAAELGRRWRGGLSFAPPEDTPAGAPAPTPAAAPQAPIPAPSPTPAPVDLSTRGQEALQALKAPASAQPPDVG